MMTTTHLHLDSAKEKPVIKVTHIEGHKPEMHTLYLGDARAFLSLSQLIELQAAVNTYLGNLFTGRTE